MKNALITMWILFALFCFITSFLPGFWLKLAMFILAGVWACIAAGLTVSFYFFEEDNPTSYGE